VKKYGFRLFFIFLFIVLSGWFLWPTWSDVQHEKAIKALTGADSTKYFDTNEASIREARAKRLKLGLDLQGGMYVTLEVNISELLEKMAKNRDETLTQILAETKTESAKTDEPILDIVKRKFDQRNIRLSQYYGDIRNSNSDIYTMLKDESEKAVTRAQQIIRNRIDKYGVSEVSITRSGSRRIIVELPGVSNEKEVRQLIQETAQLEFKLLTDPKVVVRTIDNLDRLLAGQNVDAILDTAKAADTTAAGIAAIDSAAKAPKDTALARQQAQKPFRALLVSLPLQSGGEIFYAEPTQKERINNILMRPDVKRLIPSDMEFAWAAKPRQMQTQEGGAPKDFYELYGLKSEAEMTGEVITNARAQVNQQGFGGAIVTMEMNTEGSRQWARITGENVNKQIAIALDKAVFSAPNVKQKIIGGNSMIEGMANIEEARLLEIVLKAGALPAPVEIIEERTVGPSLGEDSIRKGMNSFLIGVGLVILFMMFYYKYAGFTSDLAVIFNVVFILGILAAFHATLTLPGIAGMLLTVGMAVDANVLINERIREESTVGKTLRAAIDAGYSRAMPAIIDSNVTTIITCIILYQLGTGPVQGFALTLLIGLLCSMFTAIVMTRVMIEATLDRNPKLVTFG
jgi:SecD/SecF fusion protein